MAALERGGTRHELFTLEEADECLLVVWNEAKISSRRHNHVVFLSRAEKQTTRVLPVSVEASNLSHPSVQTFAFYFIYFLNILAAEYFADSGTYIRVPCAWNFKSSRQRLAK